MFYVSTIKNQIKLNQPKKKCDPYTKIVHMEKFNLKCNLDLCLPVSLRTGQYAAFMVLGQACFLLWSWERYCFSSQWLCKQAGMVKTFSHKGDANLWRSIKHCLSFVWDTAVGKRLLLKHTHSNREAEIGVKERKDSASTKKFSKRVIKANLFQYVQRSFIVHMVYEDKRDIQIKKDSSFFMSTEGGPC